MSKTITIIGASHVESKENHEQMITNLFVEGGDSMSISDGFHTMDELYDHRITLYIALCKSLDNGNVWRSKKHSDGELAFEGKWFVLGIWREKGKQITYHLPIEKWEETTFAEDLEVAPEWDGHSPNDVLGRLKLL